VRILLKEMLCFDPMDPRNQAWHDANNKLLQLINQFKPDRSEHQMNMYHSLQGLKKELQNY